MSWSAVAASSKGSQASSDALRASSAYIQATIKNALTGSNDSGFVLQVKQKLKLLPRFRDIGDDELTREAERLTNADAIFEEFFHGLVSEPFVSVVDEALEDDAGELKGTLEVGRFKDREDQRLHKVLTLPVVLYLRELSATEKTALVHPLACFGAAVLDAEYGPVHAMIKVGDVVLEWDDSSLVIPYRGEVEGGVVLHADMRRGSDLDRKAAKQRDPERPPLSQGEEIDRLFASAGEKLARIKKLVEVIAKYNRRFHYSLTNRNCQDFVADALKALGIKRAELKGINFERVHQGDFSNVPTSFEKHEDLDAFIIDVKQLGLLQHFPYNNIEYLLNDYLRHHRNKACQCPTTCQAKTLEAVFREKQRQVGLGGAMPNPS